MNDWQTDPLTAYVTGEDGPWGRHIVMAWQACAGLPVTPPDDPTSAYRRKSDSATHGAWLAYWAPLLQLTHFGLGWTRTDIGLSRWMDAGWPTNDPILAVIEEWWGPHLEDYVSEDTSAVQVGQRLRAAGLKTYKRFDASPPVVRPRHAVGPSHGLWSGGSDPMHSGDHFSIALQDHRYGQPSAGQVTRPPRHHRSGDRAVLIQDRYAGWYGNLWELNDVSRAPSGASLRVDVVCTPVGWLGEFRRSATTGAWFRGQHRWHILGA